MRPDGGGRPSYKPRSTTSYNRPKTYSKPRTTYNRPSYTPRSVTSYVPPRPSTPPTVQRSLNTPTSPIPGGSTAGRAAAARMAMDALRSRSNNSSVANIAPRTGATARTIDAMSALRAQPQNAGIASRAPSLARMMGPPVLGGQANGGGSYGGGGNGAAVAPPAPPPATVTPPPPVVAPPAPPTTAPGVPGPTTGSWTSRGRGGTYGQWMRQRRARGPMTGLSMTPEMLRRLAMQRYRNQ